MGFCSAGQIIISQHVGMNNWNGIQKTVGTMLSFLSLVSLAMMAVMLLALDWMLGAINVPIEAMEQAKIYSRYCLYGLFFIFGYNEVSAVLRGMGDSKRPFLFIAIAAVANICLDLLFVAGLGMGVYGAALATVLGQGLSVLSYR